MSLIACGPATQKNTEIEIEKGWKAISENNYSIQYPETWDLDKSGMMGMSFILLSKQTSATDMFRENVNLLIQDLKAQQINLDKYVEISEGQIKTLITNSNITESKRQNENGSEYQKVIYTGEQGNYKLKFEQYYWIKDEKAYVLTFTCAIDQFETYQTIGEKILNSFRLK